MKESTKYRSGRDGDLVGFSLPSARHAHEHWMTALDQLLWVRCSGTYIPAMMRNLPASSFTSSRRLSATARLQNSPSGVASL